MPHPTWRQEIGRWIAEALAEGQRRGLADKDLRRFVREHTRGWGVASGGCWAAKIWREEFRYQVKGVPRPQRRAGRVKPVPAEGQGSLFE